MTYSTIGTKPTSLTAYHLNGTETVVLVVNSENIHLNMEQREDLAAYLLKETN